MKVYEVGTRSCRDLFSFAESPIIASHLKSVGCLQPNLQYVVGQPINVQAMTKMKPAGIDTVRTALTWLEDQLKDGREWVLDTVAPGAGDIHAGRCSR